jgi:hypothetical protein
MADGGDMAEFVALRTLIDLGVVSFEGKSEEVDRDKLEG